MQSYLLIFRMDITTPEAQPTAAQMNQYMQQWTLWLQSIADDGQLAEGGHHLSPTGKVIGPGQVETDGPYTKDKESMAGYIIIDATDMEDALTIARRCPILHGAGTSVEVRPVGVAGSR